MFKKLVGPVVTLSRSLRTAFPSSEGVAYIVGEAELQVVSYSCTALKLQISRHLFPPGFNSRRPSSHLSVESTHMRGRKQESEALKKEGDGFIGLSQEHFIHDPRLEHSVQVPPPLLEPRQRVFDRIRIITN